MIPINDDSPRWLRELDRFLSLKSMIFMHGNVMDLVSFPIGREGSDRAYWTDDYLPGFFQRYLTSFGYRVVGFVDPVDGLSFPDKEMEKRFKELSRGKSPEPAGPDAEKTAPPSSDSAPTGPPPSSGPPPQRIQNRGADLHRNLDGIRTALANNEVPTAFVFNLASRMIVTPGHVTRDEHGLFTRLLKASIESGDVFTPEGPHFRNTVILICDKVNDLPPFLYVNNPRSQTIYIDKPDTRERSRFFRRSYKAFQGATGAEPTPDLTARFAALTEGLTNYELMSLVHLSRRENIEVEKLDNLCHRFKYGVRESEWDKLDGARLAGAEEHLKSRIKGQEAAIARVLDIVKRARIGLAAGSAATSSRPRGVLFFAGPTGVGKTEMAKSLAEMLFGEEDRCIRFDMSEYSAPQSDEKLLGAPPGYVGYEEGGQLTNALKEKPFSILLFDEIEKAHGSIFDKFLQILDDGRLTDGKGETIYFSETIIIFTSNLGTVSREEGPEGRRALVTPDMLFPEMQEVILEAIRDHFNFVLGRPEILNRFGDNFVVFDFIKPPVDESIVDLMTSRLAQAAKSKWKIDIEFAPAVRERLIALSRGQLHHGGRGIRNMVDSALVNPLTRYLFDQGVSENSESALVDGMRLRLNDLLDRGSDAPYRFEIRAEMSRRCD